MGDFFFFDSETTGLPARRNLAVHEVDGWPRVVQLAWAVYDAWGKPIAVESRIVRPDGFVIPEDSIRIHGITQERALETGTSITEVLDLFARAAGSPFDAVIAHNLEFDLNVVGAELLRAGRNSRFFAGPGLCTMKTTTQLLRLPGPYGYKWPKLEELHAFLFGGSYEGTHDAGRDVKATAKCFFELRRRGHYPRD
jgi:DNA polymerase-3 subunit epsilon